MLVRLGEQLLNDRFDDTSQVNVRELEPTFLVNRDWRNFFSTQLTANVSPARLALL